jgi:hypothetical protein
MSLTSILILSSKHYLGITKWSSPFKDCLWNLYSISHLFHTCYIHSPPRFLCYFNIFDKNYKIWLSPLRSILHFQFQLYSMALCSVRTPLFVFTYLKCVSCLQDQTPSAFEVPPLQNITRNMYKGEGDGLLGCTAVYLRLRCSRGITVSNGKPRNKPARAGGKQATNLGLGQYRGGSGRGKHWEGCVRITAWNISLRSRYSKQRPPRASSSCSFILTLPQLFMC